jgi:hypothetical protein
MNLDVGDGHVDVGGKDRDEEQGQTPTGQELNPARGNQESDAAEQLENAADPNAGEMKRYPGRHGRKEELRMAQMDRPGEEEERGQEETDEGADNQAGKDSTIRQREIMQLTCM